MRAASFALLVLVLSAPTLGLLSGPVSAATDDQNLTGLMYLGDGTPLSATWWANNTSFAVYVNHGGSWSTAWRYPAWPSWYLSSGGAYSIVLPAAQKGVNWENGDPYRVEVDASEISGIPGTLDNATSHGTGDAGEISPVGAMENGIVWNATDNWQRWDVVVLGATPTRPDYVPTAPQPASPARMGLSSFLVLSVQVLNQGNATAAAVSTLSFFNASTPATPFATFPVPPLGPAETSARFTSSWRSPGTPGAVQVVADVDYADDVFEWNESNNRYTWTVDVLAGPVTNLVVGQPNVTAPETVVTSATPLSFSVIDQSGTGIRNTTYRVDGGAWVNYTATGPFSLAGEAVHLVEWYSEDNAGNTEPIATASPRVDDSPPTTTLAVGDPKYVGGTTFVISSTPLTLAASDGGLVPVGIASTEYRIDGGGWTVYAGAFTLMVEGPHAVEYRATDRLGNAETARTLGANVDNTPPVTTIAPATGPFTPTTGFTLTATDGGSGVSVTEYRIDGGPWIGYANPFTVALGDHVIGYRSADHLNNTEAERALPVTIETPPNPASANSKPLMAGVFAAVLVLVGAWSARRAPWPTGDRRRLRAFLITALPFVAMEGATGVVSFMTGLLSIPPLLGPGTAVDVAILLAGLAVSAYRVRERMRPK